MQLHSAPEGTVPRLGSSGCGRVRSQAVRRRGAERPEASREFEVVESRPARAGADLHRWDPWDDRLTMAFGLGLDTETTRVRADDRGCLTPSRVCS